MADVNQVPRGPLYDPSSENSRIDVSAGYNMNMLRWRDEALEAAMKFKALSPEAGNAKSTMKYIEGDQWDQFGVRARFKSKAYVNKVSVARSNHLALLTDTRPEIDIQTEPGYAAMGHVIDGVIDSEWYANNMDMDLMTVADIAAVTGTGFAKIVASAPGMMRLVPCGMDMVMPIQPGFGIQDSSAVLYKTWKSLNWLSLRYRNRLSELQRYSRSSIYTESTAYLKPEYMDSYTWQALSPQMQELLSAGRKTGGANVTGDYGMFGAVEYQEYWIDDTSVNESRRPIIMQAPNLSRDAHNWWYEVRPGERLYPRKRLVIFGGDAVLYDGPAPFFHGLYPFGCLRLNPVFWSFWGLSKYRDMIPVNSAINEIVTGVLDTIKKALNPVAVAKASSVAKETWDRFFPSMPGSKLLLTGANPNAQNDVKFIDPPQLPSYIFEVVKMLGVEFDKLAGLMDVAALGGKKQVPGGDTLEQMRDSNQTSLRREGRLVEIFLRDCGVQAVSHITQFYSWKRRLELLGANGITIHDFNDASPAIPGGENKFEYWKKFPLRVVPGSMHGGAKDRRKMLAVSLFQMGAIGRQKLLKEVDFEDSTSDEDLAAEQQARAGAEPGAPIRMTRGQRNGAPV